MAISVNYNSEILREPNLLVPSKHPTGSVKLDKNHPLLSVSSTHYIYLAGQKLNNKFKLDNLTKEEPTPYGMSSIVSDSSWITTGSQGIDVPTKNWTLFCCIFIHTSLNNGQGIIGFSENPGVSAVEDRQILVDTTSTGFRGKLYDGNNEFTGTVGGSIQVGNHYRCVITCRLDEKIFTINVNHVKGTPNTSFATSGYDTYSSAELTMGRVTYLTSSNAYKILFGGCIYGAWSDAQMDSWVNDPYQFLIPA